MSRLSEVVAPEPSWLNELRDMAMRGGPLAAEHKYLSTLIDQGLGDVDRGDVSKDQVRSLWMSLGSEFMHDTMQGFSLLKPHGYAGDFEIIDRIYTRRVSRHQHYARWDEFFHEQAAPSAVRNRADLFGSLLTEVCSRTACPVVLNVGSGPCRDVAAWMNGNSVAAIEIECLDRDPKAHDHARRLLAGELLNGRVKLIEHDILRYRSSSKYDLVWSAGLFDYLSDRLFVRCLRRLMAMTRAGGRTVVGNFSPSNPSRGYMELFGEWYLNHRDEKALRQLARDAGASSAEVIVEAEGVNLFLVVHA